ncbi:MAG TPA: FxLYD domain-containing protein [Thermodesulfobacteriota bacterium]
MDFKNLIHLKKVLSNLGVLVSLWLNSFVSVFSLLILFFLLVSITYSKDYVIRLKSLDVSKVSEEKFQIKGELVNNTDKELKRISIKFKIYDPEGKIIEEDQILPLVNPIPPLGSSPFLVPIRYSRYMEMEKATMHVITLVGEELSIDPGGYSLEFKVPK